MGALSVFDRAASAAAPALGIAGLGLIGGSVALAARRAWPHLHISGLDAPDTVARAVARRIVDRACGIDELAACDVIVLAAPVVELPALIERLAGRTNALVTDVGSTKRRVLAAADRAGLARFVGGHPMAGAAIGGLDHASADLFAGRPWVLVPSASTPSGDLDRVRDFAAALGAAPVVVADAERHDRSMAYVSHLPQLVAVALMNAAGEALGADGLALAGPAFREMTRVAASSGELWRGIAADNDDQIAAAVAAFQIEIDRLTGPAVGDVFARSFARANAWRRTLDR